MAGGYWLLDGGPGDRHRIFMDSRGELFGWENAVRGEDVIYLRGALHAGDRQFLHFTIEKEGAIR